MVRGRNLQFAKARFAGMLVNSSPFHSLPFDVLLSSNFFPLLEVNAQYMVVAG
jgi:hypothetical protein